MGCAKLHLTLKETGRLTLTTFNRLYEHYKDAWDAEMRLAKANVTYREAYNKAQREEEWF